MNPSLNKRPRLGRRRKKGSAITEFGPALMILLFLMLFPAIDILSIFITYMDAQFLFSCLLRQAATTATAYGPSSSVAGKVSTIDTSCCVQGSSSLDNIITNWQKIGLGKFAQMSGTVTYNTTGTAFNAANGATQNIVLNMQVTCVPLIPVPFVGIGGKIPFSFSQQARIENYINQ